MTDQGLRGSLSGYAETFYVLVIAWPSSRGVESAAQLTFSDPFFVQKKPKMAAEPKHPTESDCDVQGYKCRPFVAAAQSTPLAMVFTDARRPGTPILFANDSFLSLTGYAREEVLGQSFDFILTHASDAEARAHIRSQFLGKSDATSEIGFRRKDGSHFWAALFISPVRSDDGDIVQYFASLVDLTALKEQQTHSQMLIDELNHRVKNTLATVQSIVRQALRTTNDPHVLGEAIESRLLALSRAHDLLTREKWGSAGLVDLIREALEPFKVDGHAERIVIEGVNARVPPKAALPLAISFNELATNAVKYGALSNATGSILIEWKREPSKQGNRLILHWQERGGPPVAQRLRKGFGTRVIEHGLDGLGATVHLDYLPSGLSCTMSLPFPEDRNV